LPVMQGEVAANPKQQNGNNHDDQIAAGQHVRDISTGARAPCKRRGFAAGLGDSATWPPCRIAFAQAERRSSIWLTINALGENL
jgi:hypothetical protein